MLHAPCTPRRDGARQAVSDALGRPNARRRVETDLAGRDLPQGRGVRPDRENRSSWLWMPWIARVWAEPWTETTLQVLTR